MLFIVSIPYDKSHEAAYKEVTASHRSPCIHLYTTHHKPDEFSIRLKPILFMDHCFYPIFIALKHPDSHECGKCTADSGSLICLCPHNRQSKHVGRDLTDLITLRSSSSEIDCLKFMTGSLLHHFHSVDQCEINSFNNRAIQMDPGMSIRKSYDCSSCSRHRDIRRKIWLEQKSLTTFRNVFETLIKKFLRRNTQSLCLNHLFCHKLFRDMLPLLKP